MFYYFLVTGISLAILLILSVGVFLQRSYREKTVRMFFVMVVSIVLYLIFNLLSEIFDGHPSLIILLYIVNTITFITIDFLLISFLEYLYSFMGIPAEKKKNEKKIIKYTVLIKEIIVLFLAISGNLFSFDENTSYVEGAFAIVPYVFSIIILIELFVLIIINRKKFTTKQFIIVLIYELFPLIPIIAEYVFSSYSLLGIVLTLSVLMIYVLMQDTNIEQGKVRENIYDELSHIDMLTGLKNRRSYYEKINKLSSDGLVGVIFCDINGLKYTNDHYGHTMGDKLINSFAKILLNNIEKDNVFRISGDEFVAIIETNNYDNFSKTVNSLRNEILVNDSIAAIGDSFGMSKLFDRLVAEAESKMYDNKKIYGRQRL